MVIVNLHIYDECDHWSCANNRAFARRLSHYLNAESDYRFMLLALFVICGLAGLGSIASITHLGVPLNAPNAIRNVFSAWLSREVAVTAIFVGCLGLTFYGSGALANSQCFY